MRPAPSRRTRLGLALGLVALLALLVALPHGELRWPGEMRMDPHTGEEEFVHDPSRIAWHGTANATGQLSVLLTLASLGLPYLRRPAATRVHRWLGIPILLLAGAHTAIYLADGSTLGWAPGLLSFAAFGVHGVTGAWKRALLETWGPEWWRLVHRGSGWTALLLVVQHVLMASWHFGLRRWFESAGW